MYENKLLDLKAIRVEAIDMGVDLSTTNEESTLSVYDDSLFNIEYDNGILILVQKETFWPANPSKRPSLFYFLKKQPKVTLKISEQIIINSLYLKVGNKSKINDTQAIKAAINVGTGSIQCEDSIFDEIAIKIASASAHLKTCSIKRSLNVEVSSGSFSTVNTFKTLSSFKVGRCTGKVTICGKNCHAGEIFENEKFPKAFVDCTAGSVKIN